MPATNPVAAEQVGEFMRRVAAIGIERCAHCAATLGGRWRWRVVGSVPAQRAGLNPWTDAVAALGPQRHSAQACRGPPKP